jgi:NAD(P)-dependent dehydrogenase (short-subunit alcohol dehydrogenase family)
VSGRSVLITGCSSGIGYACALGLRDRGYRVFASARAEADVRMLAELGLHALQLDVSDSASIDAAVEQVLSAGDGRLYALFNNAGYGQPGAVEDLSRDVLRAQFETNVFGLHELTCKVLPAMRAAGYGRIVHNSSILGLIAMRYRGAYQASKFAVEALADTLRQELSDTAIRVSLIEPGPVHSRFRENSYAMFKRHIDVERSPHRELYRAVERRLGDGTDESVFTLPESAVLKKLIHALEHPRSKARYYVTLPTYIMATLKRTLSSAMMDRVLLAASRSELK